MTRVFVSAWLGSGNAGDELIFSALVAALRHRGVGTIVAASLDPASTTRLHGVEAIAHRDLAAVARAIRSADALVFGGGGLLQDDTSLLSPPYQLHRPAIAGATGTPVVGVGLGVGTLRAPSRGLARTVLGNARRLVVRDEPSRRRLESLGLGQVRTGADLVFALPSRDPAPEPVLAVVLRPTYPSGRLVPGRLRVREPGASARLREISGQIDQVAHRHDLSVRLVSMEPHRDTPHLRELGSMLSTGWELVEPGLEALEAVGSAAVVLTSRFHGLVAGLHAARPVVALGYADKVEALAHTAGDAVRLLTHDTAGASRIGEAVDSVLATDATSRGLARSEMARRVREDLAALDLAIAGEA